MEGLAVPLVELLRQEGDPISLAVKGEALEL